ncbi:MAG: 50S ribosomal protein L13 [Desulfurococcales archaeon]|nr:50S ribosomal protein L13 [Desulfurococcales archaeon]MEB3758783.1 50S ribosomal protein L13 [Desulfurococcales archaeon]MEB3773084.1 50S ribosomal protein L13 [Desulfurococcales archaeon]MEB3787045.1 50S ribosomal protein L13 [Desulfurococcales archaeon]MEB3798896.1 50S ribosomal protein L13 [Desulfurococcales archaeon]
MAKIIVNGEGHILGRLSSIIAKKLLEGNEVVVVNVEKVIVSGEKRMVVDSYKKILGVKVHLSHKWRPKRPRSPIRLFKASVKGMLPKNNKKGREALSRLKVYIGVPDEFKNAEMVVFKDAYKDRLKTNKYVELSVIAKEMGWKGVEQ